MSQEKIIDVCADYKNIFIFVSKKDEVQTKSIISELLLQNKKIFVPVCDTTSKNLLVSRLVSLDALAPSSYGILEPKRPIIVSKEIPEIFFVPGMKFDKMGKRKGRGHGYFDRFLADIKGKKPIIGICHNKQLVEKLQTNPWDIPVDKVIVLPKD